MSLASSGAFSPSRARNVLRGEAPRGLLELVDVGLVGRGRVHVEAVAGAHRHAEPVGHRRRLAGESALAEPGRTADQQPSSPGRRPPPRPSCAAARARRPGRRYGVGSPSARPSAASSSSGGTRYSGPLGVDALELGGALVDQLVTGGAEHPVDGLGGEDPAGRRQPLDALGDDHRLAVDVAVLGEDLTGVEPDAHLDVRRGRPVAADACRPGSPGRRRPPDGPRRRRPSARRPSP